MNSETVNDKTLYKAFKQNCTCILYKHITKLGYRNPKNQYSFGDIYDCLKLYNIGLILN